MTDVFEPGVANRSGMDGAMDLYVKRVVPKAMVEVDEGGTVAAAATEAGDPCTAFASEPALVAIDQPFLFLIRDTKSESILFMGHVNDPQQDQ
jgi:serpin B